MKSESISALAKALCAAQKEIFGANKDATNPFFNSAYATLQSCWDAIREPLTKNGLSIAQPTISIDNKVYVRTVLMHESGEFLYGDLEVKTKDASPQAQGSGISYARRYGLAGMVGLYQKDDDAEAAESRIFKKTQEEPAKKEIKNYAPQDAPIKTINDETPMPAHIDDSLIQASKMKLSKYVIQFGKFKGKYLVTIPIYDAENYANYLETQARKDSKPLSKGAQEYIEMVGLYSKYSVNDEVPEVESIKIDEMPDFGGPTEQDEVPF